MFSDYEDNNINKDKYNDYKLYKIYGMINEIICFLGSLIYLELIEIHFCQLDYNIKKNIKIRAQSDINENDDDSSLNDENENEFRESTAQELTKALN